jgi:hypothetical protein
VGCRVGHEPVWHCESDGRQFVPGGGRTLQSARYDSIRGDYVWWPSAQDNVAGKVLFGLPPGGDFVPPGRAGTAYRSPGYR